MPAPRKLDFDDLRPPNPFATAAHAALRERVRAFIDKEIAPSLSAWEQAGTFPDALYVRAAAAGLLGIGFDARYGGSGAALASERAVFTEEFFRLGSGLVYADLATHWIALPPLIAGGEPALRDRVARAVLAGQERIAFAVTEPGGGSDVGALRTTAERRDSSFVLNGSKTLISGAMRADWLVVAARTSGSGSAGLSLLLVEANRPGVRRTPVKGLAWYSGGNGSIEFENVEIPAAHLVGPEGRGLAGLTSSFNMERLSASAATLSMARAATAEAIAHARQREAFGRRLVEHQATRHTLVESIRRLHASYAMLDALAARLDRGESPVAELALLKVQACETLERCARDAMQVLGGGVWTGTTRVERIYREARIFAIAGGPDEVLRDLAARQLGLT